VEVAHPLGGGLSHCLDSQLPQGTTR
jgi:hypothetical protein